MGVLAGKYVPRPALGPRSKELAALGNFGGEPIAVGLFLITDAGELN